MRSRSGKFLFFVFLTIVLFINIAPYLWTIITSLKPQGEIYNLSILPSSLYTDNYHQVIAESGFLRNILNSLIIAGTTSILCLLIGLPAAYAFARLRFKYKNLLFTFVLAMTIFPGIFIISPLFSFLRDIGAIDTYFALILPYIAYFTPLVVWILTGFLKTINPSIEEMAIMDGANLFELITKIVAPLAMPGIVTTGIIAFTLSWNEFLFALIFTSSDSAMTVPVALSRFTGIHTLDWGQMTAASIIATLPIIVVSLLLQRHIIDGLTSGGVKE